MQKRVGITKRASSPEWILVVDDHPDLLKMTQILLEMQGYRVHTASSGEQAIALLKEHKGISILFTDVVMPEMNGVQLAEAALQLNPGLHVVLASGYPADAFKASNDMQKDFPLLLKPYSLSELKAAIEH